MGYRDRDRKLVETVDGLADEIIDFAARLVAEPSTLHHEDAAVRLMEAELIRLGLAPTLVPISSETLSHHPGFAPVPWTYENKHNVVAVRPADGTGGRSALFNGHLDVVSAAPADLWTDDPFTPKVADGWLYGRGAGDMKSGVAAMTFAVAAVERAGFGLNAPVTVEGVVEEECCGNGALACIAAGYDADAVLIPEPFGPTLLTSQVGVLWFRVDVGGVPSHVQSAPAGTNAVEKAFPLMAALRELEAEMNAEPAPAPYRDHAHPLNLNIGIFEGGDWPSTVPAAACFHGRLSYYPGAEYEDLCGRIRRAVQAAAEADPWLSRNPPTVTFYGFRSDGHTVSRDLPALATLNDCHRRLTGTDAREYISTCTTDLRAFHFYSGAQATCYGPTAENIHAANERVRIDSVIRTAKAYTLFLADWCGLKE